MVLARSLQIDADEPIDAASLLSRLRRQYPAAMTFAVDGFVGASFYEHEDKPVDGEDATFLAGRAVLAYRFGGTEYGQLYLEPYGLFGILDPDLEVTADFAWEAAAGVNFGLWQQARLTLQGEVNEGDRNFPDGYLAGREPDRKAILLQAGVAF